MPPPLTSTQLQFIFKNQGKMKQVEIAEALKVSPAVVNYKIKGRKVKEAVETKYFDIDKEFKQHYGWDR